MRERGREKGERGEGEEEWSGGKGSGVGGRSGRERNEG